ncbi:peptidase M23 [Arcobacter sp. CECT 8989]|uniref:murein hydrolase activator EnvC family protein n=1 Tax=Arcobacter sp. CECT 8989 TaxID=2044509 RepID=UPI00100B40D9|nr:peptidoglycan DD-metalloendopeptidase family protein [Arcobacter sp. CECT 8989]RXK03684.1 peptidase M23 [Arcobacter sp. CECT 8989]
MIKRLALLFLVSITLFGASTKSIDKKIQNNKLILQKNKKAQEQKDLQIKILAKQINNQNSELRRLEKAITIINADIKKHQGQLVDAKKALKSLQKDSSDLIKEKKDSEEKIVDTIINEFSSSIALKLAGERSLQELIDSEVYTLLSQSSKDEIIKINNSYELLTQNRKENKRKINQISTYIEDRIKKKKELNILKKTHSKSLISLERKHKEYQVELKKTVQKQDSLKQLLGKLNILKKEEIEKQRKAAIAKAKRLAAQKKRRKTQEKSTKYEVSDEDRNNSYAKNLDIDVRMIGSSTSGIKISKYRGRKTIAPLDSFQVVKKFGKYYDPVYKIKLFNESIVLKTKKPQAKVKSIFNGKIVYAKKDAGMLENVVIIQHRNGLHTIYSHLDQISPSLKVGRWIKKGYVVGRVNNTLTFQATKNEMHINPKDLFKI